MYINGRWLIEPEVKAYIHKLEELNAEIRTEAERVMRVNDDQTEMLRETLPILHRAFFSNYKDTNAANELYDRIKQSIGGAENEDTND